MTEHLSLLKLKDLVDYNPGTGIFRWKCKLSYRQNVGDTVGNKYRSGIGDHSYWQTQILNRRYDLHTKELALKAAIAWITPLRKQLHGSFANYGTS